MNRHHLKKVENKWQKRWLREKIYNPDLKKAKRPFYNLMMFPYPSAEGLHVGNMYAFVGSDIYGRFKRMQGLDVFEPIGLDGFGIHSENYALKIGKHPMEQANVSEKRFYKQLETIGNGFAWNEKLETYDPDYYKWTQWIFLQLFKKGLAYRKKAPVNWCPSCKTVLADEQVIQKSEIRNQKSETNSKFQIPNSKSEVRIGVCERCEAVVIKKELEQWFFRITKYAGRLLKNLDKIDWSEKVKVAQRNWIGKSEGVLISFPVVIASPPRRTKQSRWDRHGLRPRDDMRIEVFTTRPDTLFGATYMVLAPEHELISKIKNQIANIEEIEDYIGKARGKTEEERIAEGKDKTGVELKGVKVVNPANQEEIPVWVADYVLGHVGTGAIMAVPAHDSRDHDFAARYKLPIVEVIHPRDNLIQKSKGKNQNDNSKLKTFEKTYEGEGVLMNSGEFDGMPSEKAKWGITKFVGGKRKVQYRLRDWLISRQRYWGPPIPMIYCEKCARSISGSPTSRGSRTSFNRGELENPGWIAVPEKDLPVRLPYLKNFRPTGTDRSPLAAGEKFYKVRCPKCKGWARRETDVSDTFLDSAWYYLGYLILGNQKSKIKNLSRAEPRDQKFRNWKLGFGNSPFFNLVKRWCPVDMYIGGAEHSVLHLLYARFLAMALKDMGIVHFAEPFSKFRAHGLLIKDGAKMSKSKGNVVNPDEYINKYGADVFRMYLMFLGPFEQGGDFRDTGIRGITRFLERVSKIIPNSQFLISSAKGGSASGGKKIPNPKSQFPNKSQIPKSKNDLERLVHKTVKKVTEDIENLQYNTAISALMVLLNEFEANHGAVAEDHLKYFLKLLAPFAPHMAEELWQKTQTDAGSNADRRGNVGVNPRIDRHESVFRSIHRERWPSYSADLIKESEIDFVVQVDGKVRAVVKLPAGSSRLVVEKEARSDTRVAKYLSQKPLKIVFVKDRLLNFAHEDR